MRSIVAAVALISLMVAATVACAEGKFGMVDLQKILVLSDAGKVAKEQLGTKAARYDSEKIAKEEELKKLKSDLERQNVLLSDSARGAKEKDYQQKLKEYQRFLKDAQDDLQTRNDDLTNKIGEDIVKLVQDYGKKNGYMTIFIKHDAMIFVDDKIDITDEILKQFNASRKK